MQAEIERRLEAYAVARGPRIELWRGRAVTGLEQRDDRVVLEIDGERLEARFVVGCDGARSVVRKRAGIDFIGTGATQLLRLGDVKLAPGHEASSGWGGRRPPLVPLGDGYVRVITKEPVPPGFDRSAPMTLAELRESAARVLGVELPIEEARWLSRFTDATRLAETFRAGRVLLAGDAAHVQLPAGGPGISLGLHDAINLGWKLATELGGGAPAGLLDSYHRERHAACQRVLRGTRVQGAMMLPTPDSLALRDFVAELAADPAILRKLADLQLGLDLRYDLGLAEPVGRFAPDVRVGERRAIELLRSARGVLVLRPADAALAVRLAGFAGVDVAIGDTPSSMLLRPDGIVAWADDPALLDAALARWFAA
jgi:2-polyprenyl-6-methoxyphenol hydroxylase-like FAD-dependent oxidoreductase